jgi:predicted RNA-binding protein with PUA-like domain
VTAWLLKTEPSAYSFDDLVREGVAAWDGVTSPAALGHLRRAHEGDPCVVYHTGNERQAVGLATVARAAYPDPRKTDPRLVVVDVRAGARLATPVPLGRLKADPRFDNSPLVREGRLSVVPLTDAQYAAILELAAPE